MAWHRPGDKLLSEPMMVNLLMNICITRPQWVNPTRPPDARQATFIDTIPHTFGPRLPRPSLPSSAGNPKVCDRFLQDVACCTCSVGNSHRSVSPRPTTLEEDRELFVNFSLILCLWFEIQDLRAYNFFDWISNTVYMSSPSEVLAWILILFLLLYEYRQFACSAML